MVVYINGYDYYDGGLYKWFIIYNCMVYINHNHKSIINIQSYYVLQELHELYRALWGEHPPGAETQKVMVGEIGDISVSPGYLRLWKWERSCTNSAILLRISGRYDDDVADLAYFLDSNGCKS